MGQDNNFGKKGFYYEYLVSGMFQSQGYLTRRDIPLQYGKENKDATDIDVIGIRFTTPFKSNRIICDCKYRARSKPHERVFWAKGLGQFVQATEVYVALPRSSWDFIKFASKGGVRVLTPEIIESSSRISFKYGLADETFYFDFFNKISKVTKSDKKADETFLAVRKLYLKNNPYTTLNIALDTIKNVVEKKLSLASTLSPENFAFWKYILCELTVIIGVQILLICEDVIGLPKQAREIHIKEKLAFGDLNPSKAHAILQSAENLANEMVNAAIPKSSLPSEKVISFGEVSPPPYAYDVIGLVDRAFQNPEWYITAPQVLDYLLFEQVLKGNNFSEQAYRETTNYDFAEERLKVARNVMAFVRDKAKINWNVLSPRQEDNQSKEQKTNTYQQMTIDTKKNRGM